MCKTLLLCVYVHLLGRGFIVLIRSPKRPQEAKYNHPDHSVHSRWAKPGLSGSSHAFQSTRTPTLPYLRCVPCPQRASACTVSPPSDSSGCSGGHVCELKAWPGVWGEGPFHGDERSCYYFLSLASRCSKACSLSLNSPVKQNSGQEPDGRLQIWVWPLSSGPSPAWWAPQVSQRCALLRGIWGTGK